MIRTKRYGGFLVGDRVQRKDGVFNKLSSGMVTGMGHGFIYTKWTDLNGKDFGAIFSPNQLINLTRQEEDRIPKFPRLSDGLTEEIKARTKEYMKILEHPIPFVDLTTGTIEEREEKLRRLAEQKLCKEYGVEYPIVDNPALKASKEDLEERFKRMKDEELGVKSINEIAKDYVDRQSKILKEFDKAIDEILFPKHPYPYNKNFSSTADY